jgi:branched-chain amino acid transport system substrate-binding protein
MKLQSNTGRTALKGLSVALAFGVATLLPTAALAQQKIKVGLMLPYTGTYAALGTAITNGFKLAVAENGGKLGGRDIEYFSVDDESDPAKAPENANKLSTCWSAPCTRAWRSPWRRWRGTTTRC